jgi:hypothetical protein
VVTNPGGLYGITVDRLGHDAVTSARNGRLVAICPNGGGHVGGVTAEVGRASSRESGRGDSGVVHLEPARRLKQKLARDLDELLTLGDGDSGGRYALDEHGVMVG